MSAQSSEASEAAARGDCRVSLSPQTAVELSIALDGAELWDERAALLQERGVDALLAHVSSTVRAYRGMGGTGLQGFPLLTKRDVITRRSDFLSSSVTGDLRRMFAKTSGSTAAPMTVSYDLAAWYELNYVTLATALRSMDVADHAQPDRLGVALLSNERNRPCADLILVPLAWSRFERRIIGGADANDRALIARYREMPPVVLYGKSNYLLHLASIDRAIPGRGIRPLAVLASGASLFPADRRAIGEWFDCPVFNAYTSVEGGLIAMECARGVMHVREERVVVEVLTDAGVLQGDGSGEIVLTNLCNWAMPFVRYRTGDFATISRVACQCGRDGLALVELWGREARAFSTGTREVRSRDLDELLERPWIREFEVVQKAAGSFVVSWAPAEAVVDAALESALDEELTKALAPADVLVRRRERITKVGGKARRYVREDEWRPLRIFDVPLPFELRPVAAASGPLAVAPDGDRLAFASANGVSWLDLESERVVSVAPMTPPPLALAVFSTDPPLLATAGEEIAIHKHGSAPIPGTSGSTALVVSPDLTTIAGACGSTVMMADAERAVVTSLLEWHTARVGALAFSPDGETLASGDDAGRIKLWDVATGDALPELDAVAAVKVLAYSPGSKSLASAGDDGLLRIWHVASAAIAAVRDAGAALVALAYAPDGCTIATGDVTGRVALWDADGLTLAAACDVGQPIRAIAFTRDGRFLAVTAGAGSTGPLFLWRRKD